MDHRADLDPSIDAQRAYYNQKWSGQGNGLIPSEVMRLAAILRAISQLHYPQRKVSFDSICDFGSGTGWLSNELAKFGPVLGVELSDDAVRCATEMYPHLRFQAANILEWQPSEQFDLVVSSEVLEHIVDKETYFRVLASIVAPNGYAVLTTPNARLKSTWDAGQHGAQFNELWVTPRQLRDLARPGFRVVDHRVFCLDYFYSGIFRYTSSPKLLRAIDRVGLLPVYEGLREGLGMGLYQLIVLQKPAARIEGHT